MKYILSLLLVVCSVNAYAKDDKAFTAMSINAEASQEVKPDTFVLNLNFKFTKDNKTDAQKALNNEVSKALAEIKKLGVKHEVSNFNLYPSNNYTYKSSADVKFNVADKSILEKYRYTTDKKLTKVGKYYVVEVEVSKFGKNRSESEKLLERELRKIKDEGSIYKFGVNRYKARHESVKEDMFIAEQNIKIETKKAEKLKEISKQFAGFIVNADSFVSEDLKQKQKQELFKKAYDKAMAEVEFVKKTMSMKSYDITRVSYSNRNPQPYRNNMYSKAVMFESVASADQGISVNESDEKVILNLSLDVKFYKK